jgi:hypothetical protein
VDCFSWVDTSKRIPEKQSTNHSLPRYFSTASDKSKYPLAKVYVNDEVWIEFWGKEHRGSGSVFVA